MDIKSLYENGLSCSEISKKVKLSPESVRLWLIKHHIKRRQAAHIPVFTHDTTFFQNVNEKSAYWAGWIAADGNIDKKHFGLKANISKKDSIIFDRLIEDIGYSGHIIKSSKPNQVSLHISNFKRNAMLLKDIYNITPRKSFTLQPPKLFSINHIKAFIVGYIDGDGCIRYRKNGNKLEILLDIVGTKELLEWIKQIFNSVIPPIRSPLKLRHHGNNIYSYRITGKRAARILMWLNEVPVKKLERKWEKILTIPNER